MNTKTQRKRIQGIDFNSPDITLSSLLAAYSSQAGQSSQLSLATKILSKVLNLKKTSDSLIFFGFTSNMISCGVREIIAFMCKNNLVDAIVTTSGGIEEDIMKCFNPSYVMSYIVNDRKWRTEGKNRIGNMVVPNDSYCAFEDWLGSLLDEFYEEAKLKDGKRDLKSPSEMIYRMGKKMEAEEKKEESVYYWCYKNNIPVFCPGMTDGAIGDVLSFRCVKNPEVVIDINKDLTKIIDIAVENKDKKICALVLGGGIVKYHVLTACKMAGGADFGVFVTVGTPFDGSCSGGGIGQEKTRGSVKEDAEAVIVHGEASLVFPLIAAGSFIQFEGELVNQD